MDDLYFDKNVNELAQAIKELFGTEPYVNFFRMVVTVHGVELDTLKEFVRKSKFHNLVHDIGYDHDYGYDEYNDPLTISKDRVVLYCQHLDD